MMIIINIDKIDNIVNPYTRYHTLTHIVETWLNNQCITSYTLGTVNENIKSIIFEKEADAVLFKMVWL